MRALVSTGWLASRLGSPGLRVFDTAAGYDDDAAQLLSGRAEFERVHIPAAGFLDLSADLSDPTADLVLTHPDAGVLADAFGASGIGNENEVVLYSSEHVMWATRVWWMLHTLGFDRAAVLDGGLAAWVEEGRPVESGPSAYPPTILTARPRYDLWEDKDGVMAALEAPDTVVVCALGAGVYAGTNREEQYGRPGHIAGSLNVPHHELVDPDTGRFRPDALAAEAFRRRGVLDADRVVTYCGGGLAATVDAFRLHTLGVDRVAVYDGSLFEWCRDPGAPMTVGPDP